MWATIADFAGNGAAAGDTIQLAGFGAGASLVQVDAVHWLVIYGGGTQFEAFTLANGAMIHQTDYQFV